MNKVITTLKNCVNIPYLSLTGIKTFAKVTNVKDGDTLELIIPSFNGYYRYNTRLKGIDTCEIHSVNIDVKDLAEKAKSRVIELLVNKDERDNKENKDNKDSKDNKVTKIEKMTRKEIKNMFEKENIIVWVECYDFDKYGRLLANVFLYDEKLNKINKFSISDILIFEKLAYRYDGGTKLSEDGQLNVMN